MPKHKNTLLARALDALRSEYSYNPHGQNQGIRIALAPWRLADLAECVSPELTDADACQFLTGVFASFAETIDYLSVGSSADAYDLRREIDNLSDNGAWHEQADSAVPVYTHRKWQTFVQLQAYQEDLADLLEPTSRSDCEQVANAALYQIADRLLRALAQELADKCDEVETEQSAEQAEEQEASRAD